MSILPDDYPQAVAVDHVASAFWTTADLGILDALDMPPDMVPLQDLYWKLRREWRETEQAFLTVAIAMLRAREASNTDSEPRS